MSREGTKIKEQKVLREFHRLLRSGKDFSTSYMYEEAGKVGFVAPKTAGNFVRKHYQKIITEEMAVFIDDIDDTSHDEVISLFSEKFTMCEREARLVIRYIRRNTIIESLR